MRWFSRDHLRRANTAIAARYPKNANHAIVYNAYSTMLVLNALRARPNLRRVVGLAALPLVLEMLFAESFHRPL